MDHKKIKVSCIVSRLLNLRFFPIQPLLFLLILFVGCSKSNTNDLKVNAVSLCRFTPKPYLPVYPGSYWCYKKGSETIKRVVTTWNGETCPTYFVLLDRSMIRGYKKYFQNSFELGWTPILSETLNDCFCEPLGDPRIYSPYRKTVVIAKTTDATGDSIILLKSTVYYYNGTTSVPSPRHRYQIYKKNVGLTFEYEINEETNDTTYTMTLINYFINREAWE